MPNVYLRDLTFDDVEDRYNWSLDKEVTAYLNVPDKYPPFTREETKQWIEQCINKSNGYEQKAIITEDGLHIGWIDLKRFDQINQHAEVGIAIGNKDYWGKGYGKAAMLKMLAYGFNHFHLNKIWLKVDIDNSKAITSYKSIGFKDEGIMRQDRYRQGIFIDCLRMSILKSEFDELYIC